MYIIPPAIEKIFSVINNIYWYFFIYSTQPLGHCLAQFINFVHHKQTFPAGCKYLFSVPHPESQAENWSSFTCLSALRLPAKSLLSWCMRSCWSGSWGSSSCWSKSDRSSLLSISRWAALARGGQGAAWWYFGHGHVPSKMLMLTSSLSDWCAHLRAPRHTLLGDRQHVHDKWVNWSAHESAERNQGKAAAARCHRQWQL